jgi:hypothetical protein
MKGKLIPLAFNELLCSPNAGTSHLHFAFDLRFASTPLPVL